MFGCFLKSLFKERWRICFPLSPNIVWLLKLCCCIWSLALLVQLDFFFLVIFLSFSKSAVQTNEWHFEMTYLSMYLSANVREIGSRFWAIWELWQWLQRLHFISAIFVTTSNNLIRVHAWVEPGHQPTQVSTLLQRDPTGGQSEYSAMIARSLFCLKDLVEGFAPFKRTTTLPGEHSFGLFPPAVTIWRLVQEIRRNM